MEYVRLGGSPVMVSRLGFGCDPLGGHAWGAVDRDEAIRAIECAIDCGVTLFDTADCYGLGESERLLGRAVRGQRDKVVIASKFGVRFDPEGRTFYDNSPAWLDTALDASLSRLGTDRIDLYQVHYWDGKTPLEAIFEVLERKRANGKIGWYGVTNIDLARLAPGTSPPGLVSFSFEYSLANRRHEADIERIVAEERLTFLSWGSLGQGILTGKYDTQNRPAGDDRRTRPTYVNFHGANLRRNLEIVEELRALARLYGDRTPPQIALRWILDRIPDSVVLTGIKSRRQLEDNLGAIGWRLSGTDINRLAGRSRIAAPAAV